jgi:hypothetical protein
VNLTFELQSLADSWRNDNDYNNQLHSGFTDRVNGYPLLKAHRDWVEKNQFGFGDRAFHHVWMMLVEQMPSDFAFLEIGVFKGQVLSLVAVLAQALEKNAFCMGVTTLQNTPDERCKYPAGNYELWIRQIHEQFKVAMPFLFVGKSTDEKVVGQVKLHRYNMVYVDGGHDYKDVVADIQNYAPCVKVGGFLVMDDCSINRWNIGSCWPGLEDVSRAVKDHLDNDDRFKFLFACGHLNVFWRVK